MRIAYYDLFLAMFIGGGAGLWLLCPYPKGSSDTESHKPLASALQKKGSAQKEFSQPTAIASLAASPDSKWAMVLHRGGRTADLLYCLDLETAQRFSEVRFSVQDYPKGISCAALSPDGKKVLCGGGDGIIALVDLHSGMVFRHYEGHNKNVSTLAWSKDGKTFLSGSADQTLKMWDVSTGKVLRSMGPTSFVRTVAMSTDGKWGLCNANPGAANAPTLNDNIQVWDLTTGKLAHEFAVHTRPVTSVGFSPDGKTALAAGEDGIIYLWTVPQWRASKKLEMTQDTKSIKGMKTAAFTLDGSHILSSWQGGVQLWDVAKGTLMRSFGGSPIGMKFAAVLADGKRALTASENAVVLWDINSGEQIRTLTSKKVGGPRIGSLAFLSDGKQLLSSSAYGAVLWDITTWKPIRTMSTFGFRKSSLSAEGTRCFSGSPASMWNIATGKSIWQQKDKYYTTTALSPDGLWALGVVFGSQENAIEMLDAKTGARVRVFDDIGKAKIQTIVVSADNQTALSKSDDQVIRHWELSSGRVLWRFLDAVPRGGSPSANTHLGFSPNGKEFYSAHYVFTTWDIGTGQVTNLYDEIPPGLACTWDGTYCIRTDKKSQDLQVWSPATGKFLRSLGQGKAGPKQFEQDTITFSPDGKLVAAGALGQLIRVWEVQTGNVVKDLIQPLDAP